MPAEINFLMKEIDKFSANIANTDELLASLKSVDNILSEQKVYTIKYLDDLKMIVEEHYGNYKLMIEKQQKMIVDNLSNLSVKFSNDKKDIENMFIKMQSDQATSYKFIHRCIVFIVILLSANFITSFLLLRQFFFG